VKAQILVVEDDVATQELVTSLLVSSGHTTITADDGASAIEKARALEPDLIIMDLGLPDRDGLEVCREIRETSDALILMLTGRDDEVDTVLGLKMGADDYVTKPFGARELTARVEALTRRMNSGQPSCNGFVVGDLAVDPTGREVTVEGAEVQLTKLEFDILETLCERPAHVFTRDALIERVWGHDWHGDGHLVDVHVANIRKKIDSAGGPSHIKTVRGVGFRMVA